MAAGVRGCLFDWPCLLKLDNALLSSLASHPGHTHTSTPSHEHTQILYEDQLATCHTGAQNLPGGQKLRSVIGLGSRHSAFGVSSVLSHTIASPCFCRPHG